MAIVVVVMAFVFGIAGVAIFFEHVQKMAKIRANQRGVAGENMMELLDSVRREIAELRETSTRYDVSFDLALQRIESRVTQLELERQSQVSIGR